MKFPLFKILGGLAIAFALCLLQSSLLPDYNRVYKLESTHLKGEVSIYRDKHAIPHIKADTLGDALYALGFAHAQDRLWTIDMRRRSSQGKLSEFFGKSVLDFDRFIRNLGISASAKESAQVVNETERAYVHAYIAGINDYVKSTYFLPLQYWLTWTTFEPYTEEDVFAVFKMLGFTMSLDWFAELMSEEMLAKVGPERAFKYFVNRTELEETVIATDQELMQIGLYNKTPIDRPRNETYESLKKRYQSIKMTAEEKAKIKPVHRTWGIDEIFWQDLVDVAVGMRGSNNWVIHGNLTQSGKPLLANDPHLPNAAPSIWYQVELNFGNKTAYGASVAGLPGIAIGRNDFVAWGITILVGDNADLFEETLNEDQTQYLYEGQHYPLEAREEEIKVRFGGVHKETFYSTRNGPLLKGYTTKQVPLLRYPLVARKNYSLAWTGRVTREAQLSSTLGMDVATNLKEFEEALKKCTLNANIVYATVDGDIGYYAAGIFVQRETHNYPFAKNGSSAHQAWKALIKAKDQVHIRNPKKGYIVTANNKVASNHLKTGLSSNMLSTSRALRANEMVKDLIAKNKKFDIEYMRKMQLDTIDAYARDAVKDLVAIYNRYKARIKGLNSEKIEKTLDYLRNWDADMSLDSVAASVWSVWQKLYHNQLFRADISDEIERQKFSNTVFLEHYRFARLREWAKSDPKEIDDLICQLPGEEEGHDQRPRCIYAIFKALEQTCDYLQEQYGSNPSDWAWGKIHKMQYGHLPFSQMPLLKKIFHLEGPAAGNSRTLNVAIYDEANSFDPAYSANYRMIVDLSKLENSLFTIDTGISDNPFSPAYSDQLEIHSKGGMIPMTPLAKSKEEFRVTKLTRV